MGGKHAIFCPQPIIIHKISYLKINNMTNNEKKYYNKLKHLSQYKDDEKALMEIVKIKVEEENFRSEWDIGLTKKKEVEFYYTIIRKYLKASDIDNSSDKELLKQLAYLELSIHRIQLSLNSTSNMDNVQPYKELESYNKALEQCIKVKKQLGLLEEEDKSGNDAVKALNILKARFKRHINHPDNRANYTYRCSSCQKLQLVRRRLDKEKDIIMEHPWFIKGGLLFNEHLFHLHYQGKITEDDICKVLHVSSDYLPWLYENYRIELFEKIKVENKENVQ